MDMTPLTPIEIKHLDAVAIDLEATGYRGRAELIYAVIRRYSPGYCSAITAALGHQWPCREREGHEPPHSAPVRYHPTARITWIDD